MDINTKKLKKNAFRITKHRGITASRIGRYSILAISLYVFARQIRQHLVIPYYLYPHYKNMMTCLL